MARVENIDKVQQALRARIAQAQAASDVSVVVGFTQNYGIYVHEDLEARHTVGQAKFLEEPARTLRNVLAGIVRTAMQRGASLVNALLLAGLRLQREAQLLTPVDTGALRASAFTRVERG